MFILNLHSEVLITIMFPFSQFSFTESDSMTSKCVKFESQSVKTVTSDNVNDFPANASFNGNKHLLLYQILTVRTFLRFYRICYIHWLYHFCYFQLLFTGLGVGLGATFGVVIIVTLILIFLCFLKRRIDLYMHLIHFIDK